MIAPFFYEVRDGRLEMDPMVVVYSAICWIVMGALWYVLFRLLLSRASLLPVNEPRLVEVYEHA